VSADFTIPLVDRDTFSIRDALAAEEEAAMEHRHAQRRAKGCLIFTRPINLCPSLGEPSDTEESDSEDIEDNN
jgi:hypothetical protein